MHLYPKIPAIIVLTAGSTALCVIACLCQLVKQYNSSSSAALISLYMIAAAMPRANCCFS